MGIWIIEILSFCLSMDLDLSGNDWDSKKNSTQENQQLDSSGASCNKEVEECKIPFFSSKVYPDCVSSPKMLHNPKLLSTIRH